MAASEAGEFEVERRGSVERECVEARRKEVQTQW
jgi:hypothetical protein